MRAMMQWATYAVVLAGLVLGGTGCAHTRRCPNEARPKVQRYGSVIGLAPDKVARYKELHAAVWPDVLKMITECNIRNYSIYLVQPKKDRYYLFSYFEYIGKDFEADMARMAADPVTQDWWKECKPCQIPLKGRSEDEWWCTMEEVFHHD